MDNSAADTNNSDKQWLQGFKTLSCYKAGKGEVESHALQEFK